MNGIHVVAFSKIFSQFILLITEYLLIIAKEQQVSVAFRLVFKNLFHVH